MGYLLNSELWPALMYLKNVPIGGIEVKKYFSIAACTFIIYFENFSVNMQLTETFDCS